MKLSLFFHNIRFYGEIPLYKKPLIIYNISVMNIKPVYEDTFFTYQAFRECAFSVQAHSTEVINITYQGQRRIE